MNTQAQAVAQERIIFVVYKRGNFIFRDRMTWAELKKLKESGCYTILSMS